MTKVISIFNNKGGVGKSTICWNLADSLGNKGNKVLLLDFDPQCNLSIAVLGEGDFVKTLPNENQPYGVTVRSFLQKFLQNTGREEVFLHQGKHTSSNVYLAAGDFWLNVYADSLNVGADLLSGTGLSRYIVIRRLIETAKNSVSSDFDFVLIDLPPSFGALVRAAFYASDYYLVPCTSDNFSVYCVGLIGQMVPSFVSDWGLGLSRFKDTNPHFDDFDSLGQPVFAGWIFNGFDTRGFETGSSGEASDEKKMVQADRTMHNRIETAVRDDLVGVLRKKITHYDPIAPFDGERYRVGDIEDANVLVQNSLWLNVPIGGLVQHQQLKSLQDRRAWAPNQIEQIKLIGSKFDQMADKVIKLKADQLSPLVIAS